MDATTALLGGLVAGLAVAVPLGPIGVLVVDRGMRAGLRTGLAAAGGVAFVDLVYAVVAVTAGVGLAAAIESVQRPAGVVAAVVLGLLGVAALRDALGPLPSVAGGRASDSAAPPAVAGSLRTFATFVGLTSLNPATILTFGAIVVGARDLLTGPTTNALFVLGIAVASLAWQATLATVGAALGRRPNPRVQRVTRVVGAVLLLALAGLLLVDTLR